MGSSIIPLFALPANVTQDGWARFKARGLKVITFRHSDEKATALRLPPGPRAPYAIVLPSMWSLRSDDIYVDVFDDNGRLRGQWHPDLMFMVFFSRYAPGRSVMLSGPMVARATVIDNDVNAISGAHPLTSWVSEERYDTGAAETFDAYVTRLRQIAEAQLDKKVIGWQDPSLHWT